MNLKLYGSIIKESAQWGVAPELENQKQEVVRKLVRRRCRDGRIAEYWINQKNQFGKLASGWQGGVRIKDGRVMFYAPSHPNCDKKKYVFRYRLVAEKKIGRFLSDNEHVHHKNENTMDDKPDNLQVMSQSAHSSHHRKLYGKWSKHFTQCKSCNSTNIKHRAFGLCRRCYKIKKSI